jgi:hypothetical protein
VGRRGKVKDGRKRDVPKTPYTFTSLNPGKDPSFSLTSVVETFSLFQRNESPSLSAKRYRPVEVRSRRSPVRKNWEGLKEFEKVC